MLLFEVVIDGDDDIYFRCQGWRGSYYRSVTNEVSRLLSGFTWFTAHSRSKRLEAKKIKRAIKKAIVQFSVKPQPESFSVPLGNYTVSVRVLHPLVIFMEP